MTRQSLKKTKTKKKKKKKKKLPIIACLFLSDKLGKVT